MLYYLTYTNIPTKKAFGHPIAQMCDVFSNTDDVTLVIPKKKNIIKETHGDIYKYYGLKNKFPILEIPVISASSIAFLGERLSFLIERISFAISSLFIPIKKDDVIYSRDILSLHFLRFKYKNLFLEIHYLSKIDGLLVRFGQYLKGLIVLTSFLKQELIDMGYNADRIIIAPDAVDLSLFDVIKETKTELRTRLNIPLDKKVVLYFGNLFHWKGVYTLVDAIEYVNDDVILVVVGGSDDTLPEFKKYCEGRKFAHKIIVTGYKKYTERASYLMSADVLCIPNSAKERISKYNTSPLKLFEYMASGVPILASDLPSLREVLNEDNATFFNPDDAVSLSDSINNFLKDTTKADRTSKQALVDVQQYTWEIRAKNILKFIHD